MQIEANRLDGYIDDLKRRGGKLPSHADKVYPHHLKISAASGVNLRFLRSPEGRRRLNLAIQEIGLDVKQRTASARLKRYAEESAELLSDYLRRLEERGMKLPEDPMRRGVVFLEQLKVEAGLLANT